MTFSQKDTPPNYVRIHSGKSGAIILSEGRDAIEGALLHGRNCSPFGASGRGAMASFPWKEGRDGILRQYRRGGLIRFLLRDRFAFVNRPCREFRVHNTAQERGVPVPRILGVCWTRDGIFYSGAIATERMAGVDLHDWLLSEAHEPAERLRMLKTCGSLVRQMHDTGIIHGDLQVKNILISRGVPLLLDFDAATIVPRVRQWRRECNLLRLRRSFAKRGHNTDCFEALLSGYGAIKFHRGLSIFYSVKGYLSDISSSWRKV